MNLLSNNKNNGYLLLLLASIFAVCSGIMPIYGQSNKQKTDAEETKKSIDELTNELIGPIFYDFKLPELKCDTFLLSKIYRIMFTQSEEPNAVIEFIDIQSDRWYFSVIDKCLPDEKAAGYYPYPKCLFWIREPYPTQFVYGKSEQLKRFKYVYSPLFIIDTWPCFFEYRPSTKSLQQTAPPIPENLPKNVYWCGTDGYEGDFYEYVEHSDSTIRMRIYCIYGYSYTEIVCKTHGLVITQDNWDKNYEYQYSGYELKVIEKGKDSYTILPIIEEKYY